MFLNVREIEAPVLAEALEQNEHNYEMVDVREMPEIMAGTVPNAKPMPLATLPLKLNELDKQKTLVMVCRSGARSAQACMFLQQQGFDNVVNLRGGMMAWAQGRLPIAMPQAAV
jgi:rhodanese-related sulfurtransferase